MLVNRYVVSPMRGSLFLLITTACNSAEYHRSLTVTMGRSLPILPAGMVRVTRLASASTPSICWVPNDSRVTSASLDQEKTLSPVEYETPDVTAPAVAVVAAPLTD